MRIVAVNRSMLYDPKTGREVGKLLVDLLDRLTYASLPTSAVPDRHLELLMNLCAKCAAGKMVSRRPWLKSEFLFSMNYDEEHGC
jgi:predicted protein tyrosine phosphatase